MGTSGNGKRVALVTAGSMVAALALIVVILFTMDLGRFKNQIAAYASDYLGRELAFDGELSINLGAKTRVVAQGIRLASADWTADSDLLTIRAATVTVDTWSLLTDTILVEDVDIDGISAHLAQNSDGADNYSLPGLESGTDEPSAVNVFLGRVAVTELAVQYDAPPFSPPLVFTAATINVEQRADDYLDVSLDGSLNEAPVTVRGSIGTMANLIETTNVRFELDAAIGEIAFEGSGTIDALTEPRRPELSITVAGPDAQYLTNLLGLDPVTSGPMRFAARVGPDDQNLEVDVDGIYGEFSLDLAATVADLQDVNDFDVTIKAGGPSLATLGRLAGRDDLPTTPFSVDADASRSGTLLTVERLLFEAGDATLRVNASAPDFPGTQGATANVALHGLNFGNFNRLLGLPGNLTGPFDLTADLTADLTQSGGSGALHAALQADAIAAEVTASISADDELIGTSAVLDASGADLSILTTALGIDDIPGLSYATHAEVQITSEGLVIDSGTVTLAADTVNFDGIVGREPLSTTTRLNIGTTLTNLADTLRPFDVDPALLPNQALTIKGAIARAEDAFLIDGFGFQMGDARLTIDGRVGDTFAMSDMRFDLALSGKRLAGLLPPDAGPLPEGPFQVSAAVGFDAENIKVSDLQAQLAGADATLSLSTSLANPFEAGSLLFDANGASLTDLLPMVAEYLQQDTGFSASGSAAWRPDAISLETVDVQAGDAALQLDGTVALPPDTGRSQLTLNSRLASLQNLQFLTDRPLPDQPLSVSGSFNGNPERLNVDLTEFTLGETILTGTAVMVPASETQPIPAIDVQIRSPHIDVASLQKLLEEPADQSPGSADEPAPAADPDRLIPDLPVPTEALAAVNAKVDLQADRATLPLRTLEDIVLLASLEGGALRLERFNAVGPEGGSISANMTLLPTENGADLKLRMDGSALTLGLPAASAEAEALLPNYDLTIKLASSGATSREHAANVSGYVKVVGGEGQMDLAAARFLTRDFAAQVLNTVNPFAKQEKLSHVRCMAVLVELDDGMLFGDPAALLRTDKLNIAVVAKINLETEKLNANFNTQARSGLGISMSDIASPFTEIDGTLAKPTLRLNSKAALFEGSMTVATVGLSFLAKKTQQRLFADKNPCRTAISNAEADIEARKL